MLNKNKESDFKRKAQITIFVIVAIVIVAGVAGYFLLKDRISVQTVPKQFQPVYSYYESCIQQATEDGARIAGEQGGYIEVPEFEPGSTYRPFSSQLNFFNFAIPYWYYVKGNGIAKEQIPSTGLMEQQLGKFISERLARCDFSQFSAQGFDINTSRATVTAKISDSKIDVEVSEDLAITFAGQSVRKTTHTASVNSNLGKFYNMAQKIYEKEKNTLFLENYAVDVVYLYAPVTGVEISCSPKTWFASKVKEQLQNALEANIQAIKIKGDYYSLATDDQKYFVQDVGVSSVNNVNFIYSKSFPTRIEISPEDELMLAQPVGLQEGMGILGFCYVPYHFVYDVDFPVLVQIYNDKEMFQFPIAVVIDRNKPREANVTETIPDIDIKLCDNMNKDVTVNTYDVSLNPVEADIKFKCFSTQCDIGKSQTSGSTASLTAKFPACVNGFIVASAPGYAEKKQMISTNEQSSADVILDRIYNLTLSLKVNGQETPDRAVISFQSAENSFYMVWPEQKNVQLSEAYYNVSVSVYKNGSLAIPGTKTQKCVTVPKKGIFGMIGMTQQQCFDLDIPSQTVTGVISAGGQLEFYALESDLKQGVSVEIDAPAVTLPKDITQLQDAYLQVQNNVLDINIK